MELHTAIELSFGVVSGVGPGIHVLDGSPRASRRRVCFWHGFGHFRWQYFRTHSIPLNSVSYSLSYDMVRFILIKNGTKFIMSANTSVVTVDSIRRYSQTNVNTDSQIRTVRRELQTSHPRPQRDLDTHADTSTSSFHPFPPDA